MHDSTQDPDELDAVARQCPTTWFSRLEDALAVGDFEAALEADLQLRRLGVRVRFPAIREATRLEGASRRDRRAPPSDRASEPVHTPSIDGRIRNG